MSCKFSITHQNFLNTNIVSIVRKFYLPGINAETSLKNEAIKANNAKVYILQYGKKG